MPCALGNDSPNFQWIITRKGGFYLTMQLNTMAPPSSSSAQVIDVDHINSTLCTLDPELFFPTKMMFLPQTLYWGQTDNGGLSAGSWEAPQNVLKNYIAL
jgi:hypothetical protein